jgi:hypothetical protein
VDNTAATKVIYAPRVMVGATLAKGASRAAAAYTRETTPPPQAAGTLWQVVADTTQTKPAATVGAALSPALVPKNASG